MPSAGLQTGEVLAWRYRVDEIRSTDAAHPVYFGTDEQTQKRFFAVSLSAKEAAVMGPIQHVSHPHLVPVLDLVESGEGEFLLVVEDFGGQTLESIPAGKSMGEREAVRALLRVGEALGAVHRAGAAHGLLSPACVILKPTPDAKSTPSEREPGPLVTFSAAPVERSPYRSPQRSASGGLPSQADDSWAAHALFYRMLTGNAPPGSGFASKQELFASGVTDSALASALLDGLHRDAVRRRVDLRALRRELAQWLVDNADEPLLAGAHSTVPPPLPATLPAPASRAQAAPTKKRSKIPLLAFAGIVLGLGAAWVVSVTRPAPARPVVIQPVGPSRKQIHLEEVGVTGQKQPLTGDKMASCVAGHLPKGAFATAPDLGWLCNETDPRNGRDKLMVAIITGAPKGAPATHAMKLFSRMGWYQMCAFAVVRAGCCPEASPISLPDESPECPSMAQGLRDVGHAVAAGQDYEGPLKFYTQGVHCELNLGRGKKFRRYDHPAGGEDTAFRSLIAALQQP